MYTNTIMNTVYTVKQRWVWSSTCVRIQSARHDERFNSYTYTDFHGSKNLKRIISTDGRKILTLTNRYYVGTIERDLTKYTKIYSFIPENSLLFFYFPVRNANTVILIININ